MEQEKSGAETPVERRARKQLEKGGSNRKQGECRMLGGD